ncbi:DNA-binding protein [uncultured Woeseiaceae bacterium]|uniref:DNA-binding protein n=1 Tax=uncultured Woeseiaceae bacterium TaxID=1983305 RepID=A0A7D9D2P1_9GAMM|nr:DNA-binding protein [uncultured Woeseiaceae bacterium]
MRAQDRATARKQIDKRLNIIQNSEGLARPVRGWIRAIREALGMTTAQLGKRLGIRQASVVGLEKSEASKSITLETLERAAHALDCRLVYVLVSRKPLAELVYKRAHALAKRRLRSVSHSMALEDQAVDEEDEKAHLERLVQELMSKRGSALWEDE